MFDKDDIGWIVAGVDVVPTEWNTARKLFQASGTALGTQRTRFFLQIWYMNIFRCRWTVFRYLFAGLLVGQLAKKSSESIKLRAMINHSQAKQQYKLSSLSRPPSSETVSPTQLAASCWKISSYRQLELRVKKCKCH